MSFRTGEGLNDMPTDLGPAAEQMTRLIEGVSPDDLGAPTPCRDYTLGDLLDHVATLTLAFSDKAATGDQPDVPPPPPGDAAHLPDDWQTRVPADLSALADAWRPSSAWDGMTKVAGIDMPNSVAGLVALEEIVVHGWDVARATGQSFDLDDASLDGALEMLAMFTVPGEEPPPGGLYRKVIEVPDHAPLVDRVVARAGRDPKWSPS